MTIGILRIRNIRNFRESLSRTNLYPKIAMTDYKGCDVHKNGFPNNLVPAEQVYSVEVSQPATINGKKGTKILRVDMCHEDAMEKLFNAMTALKIKPKWVFSYWGKYTKDDGTEGRKTFEEDLDTAHMEPAQTAK